MLEQFLLTSYSSTIVWWCFSVRVARTCYSNINRNN